MPHDQPTLAVETRDGHRFELIDCGRADHSAALLFLPGLGISARNCITFGRALDALGVRVFIHEWRGSGSSSLRAARKINWGYRELIAQDLDAAVAAAAQAAAANNSRFYFGGHSLGSQLACISASLQSEPVAGLIILAGGVPYWRNYDWPMNAKLLSVIGLFAPLAAVYGYFPGRRIGFAGTEARGVMFDWLSTVRGGRYRISGLSRNGNPVEAEPAMTALQSRILALRMQHDGWVSQRAVDDLLNKLPRCPAEQHLIHSDRPEQQADHFNWMKAPEVSASVIADWIQRADCGSHGLH